MITNTYLYGCNKTIGGYCNRYFIKDVTIASYNCDKKCGIISCEKNEDSCEAEGTYKVYDSNTEGVEDSNLSCTISDGFFKRSLVYLEIHHPISSIQKIYIESDTGDCYNMEYVNRLSIDGFVIMILMLIISSFCCCVVCSKKSAHNTTTNTTTNNTNRSNNHYVTETFATAELIDLTSIKPIIVKHAQILPNSNQTRTINSNIYTKVNGSFDK
jgi:hypothetical protein